MVENNNQKRQVAYKVRIKDILEGDYVVEEGWTPNYISIKNGKKISRTNLIAAVIEKPIEADMNHQSIIVDDGTGKISMRLFENNSLFDNVGVGDVILIIGKPKEYGSERYILPEIIKKVEDPKWIKVRKLEFEKLRDIEVQNPVEKEEKIVEMGVKRDVGTESEKEMNSEVIIGYIKKNDGGEGVDISEILNMDGGENIINNLLECGEVFEVRPGKIKVLE